MAKKVNGIKIYPKYSVGSILSAVFCLLVGVGIVLGTLMLPVFTANIDGGTVGANAADFLNIGLRWLEIDGLDPVYEVLDSTHLFKTADFNVSSFSTMINSAATISSTCSNVTISWYGGVYGWVLLAGGAGFLISLVFAAALIIIAILNLIFGTYPKGAKVLTLLSFVFMTFVAVTSFITTFCVKYALIEEYFGSGINDFECAYCWAPFAAWGLCGVGLVVQSWIKSLMIKGKLYVSEARKIKKTKEN